MAAELTAMRFIRLLVVIAIIYVAYSRRVQDAGAKSRVTEAVTEADKIMPIQPSQRRRASHQAVFREVLILAWASMWGLAWELGQELASLRRLVWMCRNVHAPQVFKRPL